MYPRLDDSSSDGTPDTTPLPEQRPLPRVIEEKFDPSFPPKLQAELDEIRAMKFVLPDAAKASFDKGLDYHTEGYLNTDLKAWMYYAFICGGATGLARFLYQFAENRESNGDESYKYFSADKRRPKPLLTFLISTMHPEVVKALICGNLAYRCHTDPDFLSIVQVTTSPLTTPGIYFNQLYDLGTPPSKEGGKGLSYDHWRIIHDDIMMYANTKHRDSLKLAKSIDHAYFPHSTDIVDHDKEPTKRRYLKEKRMAKCLEFLHVVRKKVLDSGKNLDDDAKAKQAQWSVFEIGYSVNTLQRLKAHTGNADTNWVWGILNAIVAYRFPRRFSICQGQLLYLTHHDERNIGEALCSVLASSYHDMMGCNPKRAGAIGGEASGTWRGYQVNIEALHTPTGQRNEGPAAARLFNRDVLENLELVAARHEDNPISVDIANASQMRKEILKKADGVKMKRDALKAVLDEAKFNRARNND